MAIAALRTLTEVLKVDCNGKITYEYFTLLCLYSRAVATQIRIFNYLLSLIIELLRHKVCVTSLIRKSLCHIGIRNWLHCLREMAESGSDSSSCSSVIDDESVGSI